MNSTTTDTGRLPVDIRFGLTNDDLAAPAVILDDMLCAVITGLGMLWLLRE